MSGAATEAVQDAQVAQPEAAQTEFQVHLANFEGPFDLLLSLIHQHRLDVTEVALHTVTDEFLAHIKLIGREAGLEETTSFLLIAATLLDLKTARLLPSAEVDNEEDLALLEARDLLFARLLQYRAYKQVAALMAELEASAMRRYPRSVTLEERYASLLPEVLIGVNPAQFAQIAAAAFRPRPIPEVSLDHLHAPRTSVRQEANALLALLRERGPGVWANFAELLAGCEHTIAVVARFLGVLELYREGVLSVTQDEALGDLLIAWTGEA